MLLIVLLSVITQVLAVINITSLPMSANLKPLEKGSTLVDHDRARIQGLFKRHEKKAKVKSVGLEEAGVFFTTSVGLGSPPTYYNLVVDTGSRFTWAGAGKDYVRTGTSIKQEGQTFNLGYGKGMAMGHVYTLTLSPSLSIDNMLIGEALLSSLNGVDGVDGILGLGRAVVDHGVVTPSNGEFLPTIMGSLLVQKKIQRNLFGMSFSPITARGVLNGKLSFGGVDHRKYKGKLNWLGVTNKEPLSSNWAYNQTIKVL
ncbi:unnamed protein product [Rhizoctonia solani]|uniref:Peptidase A1 domain-containing protein n=1 Tax=Rhizoctonia solani TaxID=456999 RepID=A0A8H3H5F1_9AGAM|nr:unnamed protein product [Rhizoctonia solani]